MQEQALSLIEKAKTRGIVLRLLGAIAVRTHCPKFTDLHIRLGREFSDLDLVGYARQGKDVTGFLQTQGYQQRRVLSIGPGGMNRRLFDHIQDGHALDVFYDRLEMCHVIDFTNRLEVDYPTIPLAELLLEKMQIVNLTEKDVIDTIVLIREHDIGDLDSDTINVVRVNKILCDDWGFYYTVTQNLKKMKNEFVNAYDIPEEDKMDVKTKIETLLARIEQYPKSMKWKLRERVGTKKRWYTEVENVVR